MMHCQSRSPTPIVTRSSSYHAAPFPCQELRFGRMDIFSWLKLANRHAVSLVPTPSRVHIAANEISDLFPAVQIVFVLGFAG